MPLNNLRLNYSQTQLLLSDAMHLNIGKKMSFSGQNKIIMTRGYGSMFQLKVNQYSALAFVLVKVRSSVML